jgi:hypothetical protein
MNGESTPEKTAANTLGSMVVELMKIRTDLEINSTDDNPLFVTIERWRPRVFCGFVKSP